MSLFQFSAEHRVLVVGGVGGIGSAIVSDFLAMGCEVVATGVDADAVKNSTLSANKNLRLAALDITQNAAVLAFAEALGPINTLVNCAGILSAGKEFELDTFEDVLDVNLTGSFRLCQACRPLLFGQAGANIINIASMNAFAALPRIPAYCASKGGVVMLTKSLALAWAEQGIRVNAVAPGYVETAINAKGRQDSVHYERIRSRIPMGRWARPQDISGSVVFLASPAAAYITGTVLAVDGGFLAG